MKKKRKSVKAAPKSHSKGQGAGRSDNTDPSRRKFFTTVRNSAIAVAVLGGGGWYLVDTVRATMAEHDLSRLGTGTPAIVQIHDPQCRLCIALQKEARKALDHFDDGQLDYIVANIRTPEGGALAAKYGVSHVTLLLFDAKGNMVEVLNGPRDEKILLSAFTAHYNTYPKAKAVN